MSLADYVSDVMSAIVRGIESYSSVRSELDRDKYIRDSLMGSDSTRDSGRQEMSVVIPIIWGSF